MAISVAFAVWTFSAASPYWSRFARGVHCIFLPPIATRPSTSWMMQTVAEAKRAYGSGGFADVLAFRIHELPGSLPLHPFIFPRTVDLMLLGAAVWRAGLFQAESRSSTYLAIVGAIGVGCGAGLAAIHANDLLHLEWWCSCRWSAWLRFCWR
jgi:uncharacterized protein